MTSTFSVTFNRQKATYWLLFALSCLFLIVSPVEAYEVVKPSFVSGDGKQLIDDAGVSIMGYISIAFGVMAGIMVSIIAYNFIQGKTDQFEKIQNLVIGTLIFSIGGSALFAFL